MKVVYIDASLAELTEFTKGAVAVASIGDFLRDMKRCFDAPPKTKKKAKK